MRQGQKRIPGIKCVIGYPMLEFSTIYFHFLEQVQVWLYWQLEENTHSSSQRAPHLNLSGTP
eukprot:scaffold759_cov122-Skeletonema_marinoi.AAC.4